MRNTKTLIVAVMIAALVLLSACEERTINTDCKSGFDNDGICCDGRDCASDNDDSGDSGIDNVFDDEEGDITPPVIPD